MLTAYRIWFDCQNELHDLLRWIVFLYKNGMFESLKDTIKKGLWEDIIIIKHYGKPKTKLKVSSHFEGKIFLFTSVLSVSLWYVCQLVFLCQWLAEDHIISMKFYVLVLKDIFSFFFFFNFPFLKTTE